MKQCPGCDYLVPLAWDECRRCGQPLDAVAPVDAGAPEPVAVAAAPSPTAATAAPVAPAAPPPPSARPPLPAPGAPASAASPGAGPLTSRPAAPFTGLGPPPPLRPPSPGTEAEQAGVAHETAFAEELFAPAKGRRPIATTTTATGGRQRRWPLAALAVVVAATSGWWFFGRGGSSTSQAKPDPSSYEVLEPIGLGAGLPKLSDLTRLEGEANLLIATMVVTAAGAELGSYELLTPQVLRGYDAMYTWVDGATTSDDPAVISVAPLGPDAAIIAVQAGPGRCALARVSLDGPQQATIESERPCRASDAPLEALPAAPVVPGPAGPAPVVPGPVGPAPGGLAGGALDGLPTDLPVVAP